MSRLHELQDRFVRVSEKAGAKSTSIGFTSPITIYERMRQIDIVAKALDTDVTLHVASTTFKSSWAAWYKQWSEFYEKTIPSFWNVGLQSFNALRSDSLAATVDAYDRQLASWREDYAKQKDANGEIVPPPHGGVTPGPVTPPSSPKAEEKRGFSLPWWTWALGGTVMLGVGYSIYKTYGKLSSRAEKDTAMLDSFSRRWLGLQSGEPAKQLSAHDPSPRPAPTECGCGGTSPMA